MKPRILTLDIETAPLESYTWGIWEQNVGLDMIATEWSILSYSAKWLGKSQVTFQHTGGRGVKRVRDDKALCIMLRNLLNEADIVIAQNGKRFDLKKSNARFIMHGIQPYSPVRVVDTMLVAKKHFAFTSNKLEWMSRHLTDSPKSKHKSFPGFELWAECLKDNPKAWAEMRKYNKQDVVATEKLYIKQLPWIENHPNMGAYSESHVCTNCGSGNVVKKGLKILQQGKYQQYQCNDCGKWQRGKHMLIPLVRRREMLSG